MGRRLVALVLALASMVALAAGAGPACTDHSCEPSPAIFVNPANGNGGELIAPDTWESTPVDATWLPYAESSAIAIDVPQWATENRPIVEMHVYLATDPNPAKSGNFAEGSGNAVEFENLAPGAVTLLNATCATYYTRIVLRAGAPDAGPLEGGAPEAAPADSSPEACVPFDASSDCASE